MAHILLSKDDHHEDFIRIIQKAGHSVEGLSMLRYRTVPFQEIPDVDCIFFYSRRGVTHFFEQVEQKEIHIPHNMLWAALGENTAESLQKHVKEVHFTGVGKPPITLQLFKDWFKGNRVLAVRANKSLNRLESLENEDWELHDLIVYSNEMKESVSMNPHDMVVLTSPLNAKAYFNFQKEKPYPIIVAIGQTTATTIKQYTEQEIFVSLKPYLHSVASFCVEVLSRQT